MDAEAMIKTNPAFNVAVLSEIFGDEFRFNLHEEYLFHGVVKGPYYKAVPFNELCNRGLLKQLPAVNCNFALHPGSTRQFYGIRKPFAINDLVELNKIASLYGSSFSIPFSITLFCCKKHPDSWSKLTTSELEQIVKILGGRTEILRGWAKSYSIFEKSVYPEGFEISDQMFHVMRALAIYCSKESTEPDIVSQLSSISVSASNGSESNARDRSAAPPS
ncbi:hypothetical protein E4T47_05395 [Aureobasidium subglaciale]|nr:hypothetical protein E4T47_05395 [Aureobasidium subglaciale]